MDRGSFIAIARVQQVYVRISVISSRDIAEIHSFLALSKQIHVQR